MAFMVQTGEGGKREPVSCLTIAKNKWRYMRRKCVCKDGDEFAKADCGPHIKECYPHKDFCG
jgi:hypothetical protein